MNVVEVINGIGRPIAFYPKLARVVGGIHECLFLCQLIYWTGKGSEPDGWIWKSREEIESETTLTRHEQATVRRQLVEKLGVVQAQYDRVNHRLLFKVDSERLDELFKAAFPAESRKAAMPPESESPSESRKAAMPMTAKRPMARPHPGHGQSRKAAIDYIDHRLPSEITAENTKTKSASGHVLPKATAPAPEELVVVVPAVSDSFEEVTREQSPLAAVLATEAQIPVESVIDDEGDHTRELADLATRFGANPRQKDSLNVYAKRFEFEHTLALADYACRQGSLKGSFKAIFWKAIGEGLATGHPWDVPASEPGPDPELEARRQAEKAAQEAEEATRKAEAEAAAKARSEQINQMWVESSEDQRKRWVAASSYRKKSTIPTDGTLPNPLQMAWLGHVMLPLDHAQDAAKLEAAAA